MVQESTREKVKKEEVDDVSVLESVEISEFLAVEDETDLEHRAPSESSVTPILRDSSALGGGTHAVIQLEDVPLRLFTSLDSPLSSGIDSRSNSVSLPRKRRRMVRVEVVVPTLRFALDRLPAGADSDVMQSLVNPRIKKMKNIELSLDTVHNRIKGMRVYPVNLDPEIRDFTVDRRFMSQFWGGNTQETFPNIAQKFLDVHHMDDFMYLNLNMNPHAPQMPGAPGLFFSSRSNMGNAEWYRQRVFSRIDSGKWQYMGQYEMERAAPLTVEEWGRQHHAVVSTWAHKVSKSGYGTRCRAIVHLRHQLGRKPAKAEIDQALQGGNRYKNVTKEQIAHALRQGWLILSVWKMKCVGYDVGFQQDLVERSAAWVPPPPKPPKNRGTPRTELKRKRKEPLDTVDSDDEYADEELVYLPKGTKRRPIVV